MRHRCESGRIRLLVSFLVLSLAVGTLAAQQTQDEVFAPFVSDLRISIRDPQIRLTWEDAVDLEVAYGIFRSTEPITNESLARAEAVATVSPGTQAYIDVPPEPGRYFYAVLALTPTGAPYRIVIPGRNASFRAVAIEAATPEAVRAAAVRGIEVTVVSSQGQQAVEVVANADRAGRTLAVYRSTEPITRIADLEDASLVREIPSLPGLLVDLPVPGVGYYYAVVDAALLLAGDATITPGLNATEAPVEIPLPAIASREPRAEPALQAPVATAEPAPAAPEAPPAVEAVDGIDVGPTVARAVPLPFIQLQNRLATGRRLGDPRIPIPEPQPIDATTDAEIAALLERVGPPAAPADPPAILAIDRAPEPEGAEYTLRTIIEGPFARMAWEAALTQLDNFLLLPLTADLEARAHFYRAQIYYRLGESSRAILELLLARDRYYVEVEAWLDRILTAGGA